jgi:hypothetical protein
MDLRRAFEQWAQFRNGPLRQPRQPLESKPGIGDDKADTALIKGLAVRIRKLNKNLLRAPGLFAEILPRTPMSQ